MQLASQSTPLRKNCDCWQISSSYAAPELQNGFANICIKYIQAQLLNLNEILYPEDNGLLAEHQ